MPEKIAIIGSGFSGLAAAAYLGRDGHEVHVFEKNQQVGGRARQIKTESGYTFDMGPSWYWMPDVIEDFFRDFGRQSSDFYELIRLEPQFEMVFSDGTFAVPADYEALKDLFEQTEKGAARQLERFMREAQYKYETAMKDFITKPGNSWLEFVSPKIVRSALKLDLLTDFRTYVRRYFSNPKLIALMEFPVIFLGAPPKDIPALYSLMNYGGYRLGTWYPMGGFKKIIDAMASVALSYNVNIHLNRTVGKINVSRNRVSSLTVDGKTLDFDAVIASSDYHHTETLLDEPYRNYKPDYWESRTFAPSCLVYYLGLSEKIPGLAHHTLFFENDLDRHIDQIYHDKKWPDQPLFYACCPSATDASVAPRGHENLFLLMPVAIGIEDNETRREQYFNEMILRLEKHTGSRDLLSKIDYKKSYCINDFVSDYNAYKGNAYGLANTLSQTAVLKPAIRNKKLPNLCYTGQLTVPGPGVPPSIISGKIAATQVTRLTQIL